MKKLLSMVFVIASIVCLSSCLEFDDPTVYRSPIAGTKWCEVNSHYNHNFNTGTSTTTYDLTIIEFTETEFYEYTALVSGEYYSGLVEGKYTYDFINNKIKFNTGKYTYGVISGNFLKLYGDNGEFVRNMHLMD